METSACKLFCQLITWKVVCLLRILFSMKILCSDWISYQKPFGKIFLSFLSRQTTFVTSFALLHTKPASERGLPKKERMCSPSEQALSF